jgi:hypothetical protein
MKKISLILLLLLCQGCVGTSLSKSFGLETKAPDEFLVSSQPPLVIPSEFNLPTPKNDTGNSNIFVPSTTSNSDKNYSQGENMLLEKASKP